MDTSLFHGNLVESERILYTSSAFAKSSLLYLQETGELQALRPHTSKRENLASYLFFIVLSGSGMLEYCGRPLPLHTGDCVFLDCRQPYFHRSSEELWKLKWAHFYGPNMNSIYDKYIERGGQVCFHPENLDPYIQLLDELYRLAASSEYIRDMRIFEKLTTLLTLLMEENWRPENGKAAVSKKQDLQEVKNYLEQHFAEKVTLDELAKAFYINKFYLTRIFKEQFGMSINSYLCRLRITQAKKLLRFTDLPIEKIGPECGIPDANYFSRTFKKVEGMTPGEYRRRW